MPLERSVSLPQALVYVVGVIIGAGIYTLIGIAAGITGNLLWFSFLIAAIIATLTAFSYAQLSSRFPKTAAETVYILKATNSPHLGFFVGFLSFITLVFSIATVAFGFATYFKLFFDVPALLVAGALIMSLSVVNLFGVQNSVRLNNLLTFITFLGLVLIIVLGFRFIGSVDLFTGIDGSNLFQNFFGLGTSLVSAAALIFFAYLGFEQLANISEEIKNPKKNLPRAIILGLIITTLLYILVSVIAVSVVSPTELRNATNPNVPLTDGPLALVAERILPGFGFWLTIMALCATGSTLLVLLVVSSRVLYGLSFQKLLPSVFSRTHPKTNTPNLAILASAVASIAICFISDLELLGGLATMGVFLLFFFTHLSLILIKYREGSGFSNSIFDPKRFSVPAIIGALFCGAMFLTQYWHPISILGVNIQLIVFGSFFFLTAFPIYYLINSKPKIENPIAKRSFLKK